jgi:dihydroflavonol-4-reductase
VNLVTGATGLVGAHVALALLRQDKPVIALRRASSDTSEVKKVFSYYNAIALFHKIEWREGDITDVTSLEDALKNIDTIYHCAGLISMNDNDEQQMFNINRQGTANLVDLALSLQIKHFCHVSSIATIQNPEVANPIDEHVYWKSGSYQSAYAISKYLAEQEVWRGIEEGLNAVIVNPGVILGPGFWNRGTGKLFSLSLKGIKFYTDGRTGFVSANDVADIMIALTEQKKFGERFILIENNYSFKEILDKIHKELNRPAPSIKANSLLLNTARLLESFVPGERKFTKATISAALSDAQYSNQKVVTKLGYSFQSLNDCISFTCQALLNQK